MAHKRAVLVLCLSALLVTCQAGFFDHFYVSWGSQNVRADDATNTVEISLTADGTGSTFESNSSYLFGSFSARIQLVPEDSAGTVAAFFLMSQGDFSVHDEIDFEFLGNASGQPYIVHTNLFANGTGEREEEIYLWFNPTTDFHTYQAIWNHELILWLIDDIPIRVYHNIENVAPLSFPTLRPMVAYGCIFEASSWATEGGAIPIDLSHAPFNVNFGDFTFEACVTAGSDIGSCGTNYATNPWELPPFNSISADQANQMAWVREHYLHYDYCTDTKRYSTPPVECQYNSDLST